MTKPVDPPRYIWVVLDRWEGNAKLHLSEGGARASAKRKDWRSPRSAPHTYYGYVLDMAPSEPVSETKP